jgi:hypothetical protein
MPVRASAQKTSDADGTVKSEVAVLTYESLREGASAIAEEVARELGGDCTARRHAKVVVATAVEAGQDIKHATALQDRVVDLRRAYADLAAECSRIMAEDFAESTPMETPIDVLKGKVLGFKGLLDSVAAVVGMFQTTTTIKGVELAVKNEALAALLLQELRQRGVCDVSYPAGFSGSESRLLKALGEMEAGARGAAECVRRKAGPLTSLRDALDAEIAKEPTAAGKVRVPVGAVNSVLDLNATEGMLTEAMRESLEDLREVVGQPPQAIHERLVEVRDELAPAFDRWSVLASGLTALDEARTALATALAKSDATGAPTLLARALAAEALAITLEDPFARLLVAVPAHSGGANIRRDNIWTGSRISHAGAALVTFFDYTRDGAIQRSGVTANYRQRKFKEFRKGHDADVSSAQGCDCPKAGPVRPARTTANPGAEEDAPRATLASSSRRAARADGSANVAP